MYSTDPCNVPRGFTRSRTHPSVSTRPDRQPSQNSRLREPSGRALTSHLIPHTPKCLRISVRGFRWPDLYGKRMRMTEPVSISRVRHPYPAANCRMKAAAPSAGSPWNSGVHDVMPPSPSMAPTKYPSAAPPSRPNRLAVRGSGTRSPASSFSALFHSQACRPVRLCVTHECPSAVSTTRPDTKETRTMELIPAWLQAPGQRRSTFPQSDLVALGWDRSALVWCPMACRRRAQDMALPRPVRSEPLTRQPARQGFPLLSRPRVFLPTQSPTHPHQNTCV